MKRNAVIRLLIFLVAGSLCAVIGLVIGMSSHQVTYHNAGREIIAHFLSGGGSSSNRIGYLQMENDANLYIINEDDFSPSVKDNSFGDGDDISFIYQPEDTTTINVSATNTSTHLQGPAYTIEQFTVLPSKGSNSQGPVTYASFEYSKDPNGFYKNNWPLGVGLLAAALILIVVGFVLHLLLGRRKVQIGADVVPSIKMPVSQDQQPQAYAYQQPYTQYPPSQQYQQEYWTQPGPGQHTPLQLVTQDSQPAQRPKPQFQPRPGQFKPPQPLSQHDQPVES